MADSYLAIAQIAADQYMQQRVTACTTQQVALGSITVPNDDVPSWVNENRYVWAASPSWGEKWDSALASHPADDDPETPEYFPGADAAVISDGDILSTVQALAGAGQA